ncbi:hypothetical protein FO519_005381 [Halicephalobus sp. NKZ332]|nr:hypothetical protein FO519_005381 [Halicephalobus sp. NKZ332]
MNQILAVVIFIALGVRGESGELGCSMRDVMSCVIQLKSYNVPIDTNMMNVVFNVSTEAKLVHVCRAYNNVMPCFQQRLATCANEKQRIRLAEVNRLLLFICAPFSLQRQKTLLKVGKCIGQVLTKPVTPNCPTKNHRFGHKLMLCRENCEANDVVCLMRVRMSELAVCSVIAIEKECGREAADFYSYMQTAIIGEEFPIQFPALAAAKESYTPKIEFSSPTTTLPPTTTSISRTFSTTPRTVPTTSTTPRILSTTPRITWTTSRPPSTTPTTTTMLIQTTPIQTTPAFQWPSTMMIMIPASTARPPVPSTVDKFLPWYYNTFTTKKGDPLVTSNPMFPYFNPESLSKNTEVVDPYYSQNNQNFDSNQFASKFVSNMNPPASSPITASPPHRISEELSNLLDYSHFKEKADAFLTTAIDVLKPRDKGHKPQNQQGFYIDPHMVPEPIQNHISHHPGNRTASGALSELMDTIERISPAVIDNIREKLDSLGHN